MVPHTFGVEHFAYLGITLAIGIIAFILLKKFVKTDEQKEIMFRVLGVIAMISVIASRLSIAFIKYHNAWYLIPDSYCGMSSLLLAISLLFFKKDNLILHAIWLIVIAGMVATLVYPDFLGQSPYFFYLPTITGLWHHTVSLFNIICVLAFGYMKLSIKKSWVQPIAIATYVLTGLFMIYVAGIEGAMSIKVPVVEGTPLYFWLLIVIYSVVYWAIMITIELIRRKKTAN